MTRKHRGWLILLISIFRWNFLVEMGSSTVQGRKIVQVDVIWFVDPITQE